MIHDNVPAVFVYIGHQIISGVSKTAASATALCASWQCKQTITHSYSLTSPRDTQIWKTEHG